MEKFFLCCVLFLLQLVCRTDSSGRCEGAMFLPSEWFDGSRLPSPIQYASVEYRLESSLTPASLGRLSLHSQTAVRVRNDVVVVLPDYPVITGQLVSVPVYAHAVYAVASFSIRCDAAPGVEVFSATTDSSRWTTGIQQNLTTSLAVVGVLRQPELVADSVVQRDTLFNLQLRVSNPSLAGSSNSSLSCTAHYVSNIRSQELLLRGLQSPSSVSVAGGDSGRLRNGTRSLRGLVASTNQSELVDMESITGSAVVASMDILAIYSDNTLERVSATSCMSLSTSLQVNDSCTHVRLSSTASPETNASISLVYQGHTVTLSFKVWTVLNHSHFIELAVKPSHLGVISNFSEEENGSCVQRYQSGRIEAIVRYSSDGATTHPVSVLPLILPSLVSSNSSIASISMSDGRIRGIRSGLSTITAYSRGAAVATTQVIVDSLRSVTVTSISVVVTTGVSLTLPLSPLVVSSMHLANAQVKQDFNFEGVNGTALVTAVLSDDSLYPLTRANGLTLRSLDTNIVRVLPDNTLSAVMSGSGNVLEARWQPPSSRCSSAVLGVGIGSVSVQLPSATAVGLTSQFTTITTASDSARHVLPITSLLTVTVTYETGRVIDLATDSRTTYTVSPMSGLFSVVVSTSSATIVPNTNGMFGSATLTVSFSHLNLTSSLLITVTGFIRLSMHASPYPEYPLSIMNRITSLYRIHGTSPELYQRALAHVVLHFTDNSTADVSTHSLTLILTDRLTDVSVSTNVISPRSTAPPGIVVVTARFGVVHTASVQLYLNQSNTAVTMLSNLSLSTGSSLSGLRLSTGQSQLSAMFSDGTQYPALFQGSTPLLSGLISFALDTPSAASVDTRSGLVSLLRNHHSLVTLTASASSSTATANVMFSCNLDPDVGDVDLGNRTGLPIENKAVGELFVLPMYVNTGTSSLGDMRVCLFFDQQLIRIVSSTVASGWPGATLSLQDIGGQVCVTASNPTSRVSGVIQVVDFVVSVLATGQVNLDLRIERLNTVGPSPTALTDPFSLARAGKVSFLVRDASSRTRRSVENNKRSRQRRAAVCANIPCAVCPGKRPPGDADGSCVFDGSDVSYLIDYLVEGLFNFQLSTGQVLATNLTDFQRRALDTDGNSVVDAGDLFYLQRVNLGLLYFLESSIVLPVQSRDSSCLLVVNATLQSANGSTSVDADVFVDISLPQFGLLQQFDRSVFLMGSLLSSAKARSIEGGVVRAVRFSDGVYGVQAQFEVNVSNIGVSFLQVTYDENNRTTSSRAVAILGSKLAPLAYQQSFQVDLTVHGQPLSFEKGGGFNPHLFANNTLKSSDCTVNTAPLFNASLYTVYVSESSGIGDVIFRAVAVDGDAGTNSQLIYSLSSNISVPFNISSASGDITVASALDRETVDVYRFEVRVRDGSLNNPLATSASIVVNVTDSNDNTPVVNGLPTVLEVTENTPTGTVLLRVNATDNDIGSNGDVSFVLLSATPAGWVTINASGVLSTLQVIDREQVANITVTIAVSDNGFPRRSVNASLTIIVQDLNDNVPMFTMPSSSMATVFLLENSSIGYDVYQFRAVDNDQTPKASTIVYRIVSANANGTFKLSENSGQLTLNKSVDFERHQQFTISIEAINPIPFSPLILVAEMRTLLIQITDFNEHRPVFTQNTYRLAIPENTQPGALNLSVSASDPDGSNVSITYSIVSGDPGNLFSIDSSTGDVVLVMFLDFETADQYNMTVRGLETSTTGLSQDVSLLVVVTPINESPPVFTSAVYTETVLENITRGSVVAQVVARDNDTGLDGNVTFRIVSGNVNGTFAIDILNGTISLAMPLDREAFPMYSLVIEASDQGQPSFTSMARVTITVGDVNDNAPTISPVSSPLNISIDSPVGTPIVQVMASDPDVGSNGRLTFSIASGNINSSFQITNSTGVIELAKRLLSSGNVFLLDIEVSDHGQPQLTSRVNVTVNTVPASDFAPRFTSTIYMVTINESLTAGSDVITINATVTRPLAGGQLTYSISDPLVPFTINPVNGTLMLNHSIIGRSQRVFNFLVRATVSNNVSSFESFTNLLISVSQRLADETPVFTSADSLALAENASVGMQVGKLEAVLPNFPSRQSDITYMLASVSNEFSLNTTTGLVYLKSAVDREQVVRYALSVTAINRLSSPVLSANLTLTINISDVNDNPPEFGQQFYNASIPDSAAVGSVVANISARDADLGLGAQLVYTVSSQMTCGSSFSITSAENASITIAQPLEVLVFSKCVLTVTATDRGPLPLSTTVNVSVFVTDGDNHAAMFAQPLVNATVAENSSNGTLVTIVMASDLDTGMAGTIRYDISGGSGISIFRVDSSSGMIFTNSLLDRENLANYTLLVSASNPNSNRFSPAVISVYIVISNVNDHGPVFTNQIYPAVLVSSERKGTEVVRVQATDRDSPLVVYSLINAPSLFSINSTSGIIILSVNLNASAIGDYSFTVVAVDNAVPQLSSNSTVRVTILRTNLEQQRQEDLIFSPSGGSLLQGAVSQETTTHFQQGVVLGFHNTNLPQASVMLRGGIVPSTSTPSHTTTLLDASRLSAVLLTHNIFYDAPVVRVSVQVSDRHGSVAVNPVTATVTGRTVGSSSLVTTGVCNSDPTSGHCIASLRLQPEWFEHQQSVSLQASIAGASTNIVMQAIVNQHRNFTVVRDVIIQLPTYDLYQSGIFTATVFAHADFAINGFDMSVHADSNLDILSISINQAVWSATSIINKTAGFVTVNAVLTSESSAPTTRSTMPTQLFSINLRVGAFAQTNSFLNLTSVVETVTNIKGDYLQPGSRPTPTAARFYDRLSTASFVGGVFVARNELRALLAYSAASNIFNMAAISGRVQSIALNVFAVYATTSSAPSQAPAAVCRSTSTSIHVSESCVSVAINGSHAMSDYRATVDVSFGGLNTSVALSIWQPILPFSLSLSNSNLKPIANFQSQSCAPRYQTATVQAAVNFTNGIQMLNNTNIGSEAISLLSTKDTAILYVNSTSGTVTGLSPGQGNVQVVSIDGRQVASVLCNVTNAENVNVDGIDASVITSLSLVLSTSSNIPLATGVLRSAWLQEFNVEGQIAYVHSALVLSDGSRQILSPPDLVIQSLNPTALSVSLTSGVVTARSSDVGELLLVNLVSPCSNATIASSRVFANISLPLPDSVVVRGAEIRITPTSDPSSLAGVRTQMSIRVFLLFPGGREQEMTTDSRTEFNFTTGSNLVQGVVSRSVYSVRASGGNGSVTLSISFNHLPSLSAYTVAFSVVQSTDLMLSASPYPTFPGSSTITTSRVHPIASTGVFQQALLASVLHLSDGTTRTVSGLTSLSYSIQKSDVPLSSVSIAGVAASRRLAIADRTVGTGTVTVSADLAGLVSAPLDVFVEVSPVVVRSLSLTATPSQLTGLRNVATSQIIADALFNDSSRYPVYSGSLPALPGLLHLTTSHPSVASVNSATGTVTLLGNSRLVPTTITAQTNMSGVGATVEVECNLDPGAGDIDLGQRHGLPVPAALVGSIFTVPIRVNTNNLELGSFDCRLSFNSSVLRVMSLTRGSDLPSSAVFAENINDPVDEALFGGSIASAAVIGNNLHIADVQFQAQAIGTSHLLLQLNTLATRDVPARDIGASTPRDSLVSAGLVQVVTAARARRSMDEDDSYKQGSGHPFTTLHSRSRRQTSTCTIPCQAARCNGGRRETGDTDGDCVFDIRDVTFTQQFLASRAASFSDQVGQTINAGLQSSPDRLVQLDADNNGIIDINDAIFLTRVNFRLLHFATSFTAIPVQATGSNCNLTLSTRLLMKGDIAVSDSQSSVAFVLASSSVDLSRGVTSSTLPVTGSSGSPSITILSSYAGNGTFTVQLPLNVTSMNIGVSIVQVTVDALGVSSPVRQLVMRGVPTPPFLFASPVSLTIMASSAANVSFVASSGYNPGLTFNNTLLSYLCRIQRTRVLGINPPSFMDTIHENQLPSVLATFTTFLNTTQLPATPVQPVFSITGSTMALMYFSVNNQTGELATTAPLDRETVQALNFTILASMVADGVLLTATATVEVTVSDINDNAPIVAAGTPTNLSVSALTPPGSSLFVVNATDADHPLTTNLSFEISGSSAFNIGSFGEVITSDYLLEQDTYELNITVYDSSTIHTALMTSFSVTINVLNRSDVLAAPRFVNFSNEILVAENSPIGAILTRLETVDLLASNVLYAITSLGQSPVLVNITSGVVSLAQTLDYESQSSYTVSLIATRPSLDRFSAANASRSFLLRVEDVNEAPLFNSSAADITNITIKANVPAHTFLGRFPADDQDTGRFGVLTFSILSGNDLGYFAISPAGELSTNSILFNSSGNVYGLQLSVTDGGQPSLSDMLHVTVTIQPVDAPIFDAAFFMASIEENSAVGTSVLSVNATGDNVTVVYSIDSGNGRGSFSIDSASGLIFVALDNIDAESVLLYSLRVQASALDVSTASDLTTAILVNISVIDENDNPPVFAQQSLNFSVVENVPLFSDLHTVVATDRDVSPDNSLVTITAHDFLSVFRLNASSGVVENIAAIDREAVPFYTIRISASDNGTPNLTTDTLLNVTVLDLNDNTPRFVMPPVSIMIDDTAIVGRSLAQFSAMDPDSGSNGSVIYLIGSSSLSNTLPVALNESTGELVLSDSLHSVGVDQFTVNVIASDQGSPPLSSMTSIVIHVQALALTPLLLATGGVQLLDSIVSNTSVMSYTHQIGLLTGPVGTLSASFGGLQTQDSFSYSPDPPANLSATLLASSRRIFCRITGGTCAGKVAVALQAKTAYHQTVVGTELFVMLQSSMTPIISSCTPSTSHGVCVAFLSIPKPHFPSGSTSRTVNITYGTSSAAAVELLGSLQLQTISTLSIGMNNVLLELPQMGVFQGQTFEVRVSSQTQSAVVAYTVSCSVASSLQISSSVVIDSRWDYQVAGGGRMLGISATLPVTQGSGPPAPPSGLTHLFSLRISVVPAAVTNSNASIQCTVQSLVTTQGAVQPASVLPPYPAISHGIYGMSSSGGSIFIQADEVTGLFAHVQTSELINTAVMTGSVVTTLMQVIAGYSSGRINPAASPSCTTSSTSLHVDSACTQVNLYGNETTGSTSADVTVTVGQATVSSFLIVWYPSSFSLVASDYNLSPISSWKNPRDSCRQQFQHSALQLTCSYSNGLDTVSKVDATDLVTTHLRVNDTSVAVLDGSTVIGRTVGGASIRLESTAPGRSKLAEVIVYVISQPVSTVGLSVTVATSLQIITDFPAMRSRWRPSAMYSVTSRLQQNLNLEGRQAQVIVGTHFSDGQAQFVTADDGVLLMSLNQRVVSVSNTSVTTVGSGRGSLVQAQLTSGHCDSRVLANGSASLAIDLPAPIGVALDVNNGQSLQITGSNDVLANTGVPTQGFLRSTLFFSSPSAPGGRVGIDMTSDNRTLYSSSSHAIVISRQSDGAVAVSVNSTIQITTVLVIVSVTFAHTNLTASVSISIVMTQAARLSATPFPSFQGSENFNVMSLSPVSNTGVYQQAVIKLFLIVSAGPDIDVTDNAKASVLLGNTTTHELLGAKLNQSPQNGFLLNVMSPQGEGNITISGDFASVQAPNLMLEVSSTPVEVMSLRIHSLSNGNTLRGVANMAREQLVVEVQLADGTQYPSLFAVGSPVLPNLLTFSSNQYSQVAGITSGVITPTLNSPLNAARVDIVAVASSQCTGVCANVTTSIAFSVNLDPAVGDVDIGVLNGASLSQRRVGQSFVVAVRLNSGTTAVGSLDVSITYDASILNVTDVQKGSSWRSGALFISNYDTPGVIQIVASSADTSTKGSNLNIADITLVAAASGQSRIAGNITTLRDATVAGITIGGQAPRQIVAGNVMQIVTSSRKRRSYPVPMPSREMPYVEERERRAAEACSSPPCAVCNGDREIGDTSGNCIFDAHDITYTLLYLAESAVGFSTMRGRDLNSTLQTSQLVQLDANGNGLIDSADAVFLLRFLVGFLYALKPPITVIPVSSLQSQCMLTVSVQLVQRGDLPLLDPDQAFVVVHLAHINASLDSLLNQTLISRGRGLEPAGNTGVFLQAEYNNMTDRFELVLSADINLSGIGLSVIELTQSSGGATSLYRQALFYGQPYSPHIYSTGIDEQLVLGNHNLNILLPNGFDPLLTFNNDLPSSLCSENPLIADELSVMVYNGTTAAVEWIITNPRQELQSSFNLNLTILECVMQPIGEDGCQQGRFSEVGDLQNPAGCHQRSIPVFGLNTTLYDLRPFSVTHFRVLSLVSSRSPMSQWMSVSLPQEGRPSCCPNCPTHFVVVFNLLLVRMCGL